MADRRFPFIGFYSYIFKMAVIQENSRKKDTDALVPKTKMVDVGKLIGQEPIGQESHVIYASNNVCAFDFVPRKTNGMFGADHMTRISHIYSRLPITHSLTF